MLESTKRVLTISVIVAACSIAFVFMFSPLIKYKLSGSSESEEELRCAEFKIALSAVTHLAYESGYMETNGLSYRALPFESGIEVMASLKNRTSTGAHVGNLAYTPIANLIATGNKPVIIASTLSSWDHMQLVTFESTGIDGSAKSLKGKRVGRTPAIISHTYLRRLLASENMTEDDIIAVGGSPSQLKKLLVNGDLDAAILWPPYLQQMTREYEKAVAEKKLKNRGGVQVYVNSDLVKMVMSVVVPEQKLVEERPRIEKFLRCLINAESLIKEDRDGAQSITEKWLGLKPGDLDQFFATTKFEVIIDPQEARTALQALLEERKKQTPTTSMPKDLNDFIDPSLLLNIDPSRVTSE